MKTPRKPKMLLGDAKRKIKIQKDSIEHRQSLEALQLAINQLYQDEPHLISFEKSYRHSYYLVKANLGNSLFRLIKRAIEVNLIEILNKNLSHKRSSNKLTTQKTPELKRKAEVLTNDINIASHLDASGFLNGIKRVWQLHQRALPMLQTIFASLDDFFEEYDKFSKPSIRETGLSIFRTTILESLDYGLKQRIVDDFLKLIEMDRSGLPIDGNLLREVTAMYSSMGYPYFKIKLETPFLKATQLFYQTEAEKLISYENQDMVILEIKKRLNEELDRRDKQIPPLPIELVNKIVLDNMFLPYIKQICSHPTTGLLTMLRNAKLQELRYLYDYIRDTKSNEALNELVLGIQTHLSNQIAAIINLAPGYKSKANPYLIKEFICQLDKIQTDWMVIYETSFLGDMRMQEPIARAITKALDSLPILVDLLVLYVDEGLRLNYQGKLSFLDFETLSEQVIPIFRYLGEKDRFELCYRDCLARRLLTFTRNAHMGSNVFNPEAEFSFLTKLELECGALYTKKLKLMISDLQTSLERIHGFDSEPESALPHLHPLSVMILTSCHWPLSPSPAIQLPSQLERFKLDFDNKYNKNHHPRRLLWLFNLGHAELKINYLKAPCEAQCTTLQMLVLLLFNKNHENKAPVLSYASIEQATQIPSQELRRTLMTLIHPKMRLLLRNSKPTISNEGLVPTDTFELNLAFRAPKPKFKLLMPSLKINSTIPSGGVQSEIDAHTDDVKGNDRMYSENELIKLRRMRVDAALVRVMKARKRLEHDKLVSEAEVQLQRMFQPDLALIKQRIDSLIERELIARDDEERDVYHYI